MKGFKGFNPDFTCKGKQYSENTVFEEEKAEICNSGMHFCEYPLDVFKFYPPVNDNCELNEFAEVEALDGAKTKDNIKYCTKKLKVGTKIGIPGLIQASVDYIVEKAGKEKISTNTGYCSASTNTGDFSASTNTGDFSASTNTGDRSASTNTGNRSASTNTGDCSASTNTGNRSASTNTGDFSASTNTGNFSASTNTGDRSASTNTGNFSASTNTGDRSASTNTGYCSASTNTGDFSASTNTGDRSASTNTGYCSASTNTGNFSASTNTGDFSASIVEGKDSVAIAFGVDSKAKGALGCYISLAEWKHTNNGFVLKDFQSVKVDDVKIKADTFYKLQNGEFVEAEDEMLK